MADFSSASSSVSSAICARSWLRAESWPEISPRQQELGDHEDRQEEGDDQQELRHRIDEARPVVTVFRCAGAGSSDSCHRLLFLVLDRQARTAAADAAVPLLPGCAEHQALQFALLRLLGLRPLPHDFLLLAHLRAPDLRPHRPADRAIRNQAAAAAGPAPAPSQRLVERLVDPLDALLQDRAYRAADSAAPQAALPSPASISVIVDSQSSRSL